MGGIITIAQGTKRANNELGHIVDTYETGAILGPAYSTFGIIDIPHLSRSQIDDMLTRSKRLVSTSEKYSRTLEGVLLSEIESLKTLTKVEDFEKILVEKPKVEIIR